MEWRAISVGVRRDVEQTQNGVVVDELISKARRDTLGGVYGSSSGPLVYWRHDCGRVLSYTATGVTNAGRYNERFSIMSQYQLAIYERKMTGRCKC